MWLLISNKVLDNYDNESALIVIKHNIADWVMKIRKEISIKINLTQDRLAYHFRGTRTMDKKLKQRIARLENLLKIMAVYRR